LENVEILEKLQKQFTEAVDNPTSIAARDEAELHRQYYDGIQWTSKELETLRSRNQAPIVDNRIKDKVEHLLGLERRTRTDPKAYPRNPQDEKSAEAASDALRFVADSNEFQQIKSQVAENMLVEGYGACEVVAEKGPKYVKVVIRKIRWDRFYFDPFSREADFSDASFLGIVTWMDAEVAKQRWPDKADLITESMVNSANSETFEDRPRWVDGRRKRVQVFETYYREGGEWWRAVWFKGGMLEDAKPSYYVDPDGVREGCIVAQSLYVDNEGGRYGIVRRYKTLQDEINHRRSKALHILSTRNIVAEKGAVDDVNTARREIAKPDGYVEVTPGMRFDVVPNVDMAEGQFRLLLDAMNALAVTGPNAALQGVSGNLSGRAKQLDQEGGAIQLGVYLDSLRYFQRRVMRHVWSRVRQFWDQEMWVRVRDEEGAMMFVALNQRITKGEVEAEKLAKANLPPEQKAQMVQQIAQDPMSQIVVIKNNLAELDVDIIIDESPDTVNIQAEQFEQFVLLAKAGVVFPPKAYVEASMLRNKQKYMDMLAGGDDPQVIAEKQKAQRLQEEAMQIAKEQALADVRKTISEANENDVQAAVALTTAAREAREPIEKSSPD
jgi:hypothetical protein